MAVYQGLDLERKLQLQSTIQLLHKSIIIQVSDHDFMSRSPFQFLILLVFVSHIVPFLLKAFNEPQVLKITQAQPIWLTGLLLRKEINVVGDIVMTALT